MSHIRVTLTIRFIPCLSPLSCCGKCTTPHFLPIHFLPSTPFALFLRSPAGGVESDVGESRSGGQNNGVLGDRLVFARTKSFADYQLTLTLRGKAAIVVNDIVIEELPPGDLFQPHAKRSNQ